MKRSFTSSSGIGISPACFLVINSVLESKIYLSIAFAVFLFMPSIAVFAQKAPATPTGLAATAGDAQVSLSWNSAARASSYNVKRSTTAGGPYTTVANVTSTAYTNTGLTNGTVYYYVVSAVNSGGESANSSQVSATPQVATVPGTPTGLTASAGDSQASLSWTASSGATSYNVKRATSSGGPYTTVASGITATSYTNTGLSSGTTYYYVVSAVNANGESANSSEASATPQGTAPAPPTGLTASAGDSQASLSWTASSGAISYNVKRATISGGPYTTVASEITATSYTNTGLSNGTTYHYVVSAVNANGESANSSEASATPSTPVSAGARQMEKLNRGLFAMRTSSTQVYVGWRMFGTDPSTIAFNVYRAGVKLNSTPITNSTNYVDNTSSNSTYTVRPVVGGVEQSDSETVNVTTTQYLSVSINQPAGGTTPDGVSYTYSANDCSVADLDGDGTYDYVVKWDPSNSKDNSSSGYTGNQILDGYKSDGTHLWRIDLGINIRSGAHYTQFMVYDLDGDGKAEVACRTADGTVDGLGVVIGNASADYRNTSGYILSGPEYFTVFNGETGAAMATTDFVPARGNVSDWGDSYGNRVDRFISTIAYVDGVRPSVIMGRGYYTRLVRVAWDWRNGQLTQRWVFDSDVAGNGSYYGQGNHQLTVGDVDNDGKDEIINGPSAIDDDGSGLYSTGLGHGDALHMSDMDPDVPGQEIWQCFESPSQYGTDGLRLRSALTGATFWGVTTSGDVGRALAADIDPAHKGYECWGSSGNLYDCKGVQIGTSKPSVNHAIWWDADLQRELMDGPAIDKWVPSSGSTSRLITLYNIISCGVNNSTKNNPCLTADVIGDWREEAILRTSDQTKLVIFTTTTPATNRIYTLMHDPQYRCQVAQQNSAYNQPPHPSFYLGGGMSTPPTPNIYTVGNTTIASVNSKNSIFTQFSENQTATRVAVYPNPTSSTFTISAPGMFSYKIFSLEGVEVERGEATNTAVAGASLKPGNYIIRVTGELNKTMKIIKN